MSDSANPDTGVAASPVESASSDPVPVPPRSLVDEIVARRTQQSAEGKVYLDGETWSQAQRVKDELTKARKQTKGSTDLGQGGETRPLEEELDRLLAVLEESAVVFTFKSLSDKEHSDLIDAHPSKEDGRNWDPRSYPQALIAATCIKVVGPGFERSGATLSEVEQLYDILGPDQTDDLFTASWDLTVEGPKPFIFAASDPTAGSALSSTIASAMESLTAGS